MFCSLCKSVANIQESRRKICPVGHVACELCDENLENCPVCRMQFTRFVCVQITSNVPRLFITYESTLEQSEHETQENVNLSPNSSSGSDSIQHIIEDMKVYDGRKDVKHESNAHPVFGCFEVVDKNPSTSFVIDGEDEQELIMKCFKPCDSASTKHLGTRVANKQMNEAPSDVPSHRSSLKKESRKSSKRNFLVTHREIQTSVTCFAEDGAGDSSNDSMCASPLSSKNFTLNTSDSKCNYLAIKKYDDESESTTASCDNKSVLNIFQNRMEQDSDTAHFTSLTMSAAGPSPLNSPPKKGFSSLGYRVKYSSTFADGGLIPAQSEPLIVEVSSDSYEELSSDQSRKLSRFPVRCPITNCDSLSVPSDFCNHITIDHPHIDVLKIPPGRLVNMKINHKGNLNMVLCQRLFLVTDKIADIGYGIFENCLPVVLLTSKMTRRKVFGCSTIDKKPTDEYFYIFPVGVYQFPIKYTITLWSHGRYEFEPTLIKSMSSSSSVFFMNKPFSPKGIAANALAVSQLEIQKLTNDGNNMLSCQIVFH